MSQAWSALSVSEQLPVFHMFWCVFQESLPWFYWMWSEAAWLVVPRIFFLPFFKMGLMFFLVWAFALLLRLLGYDWKFLSHFNISLSLQNPGIHLTGSYGLMNVVVSQVVFNLSFTESGGNCSLQSQPWGSGNWEKWEGRFILKSEVKNCWIVQPSPYRFSLVLVSYLSREGGMFNLIFLFLASVPVELCISFLHFSLIKRLLISHVYLLFPLPIFLHMVIENSWTLWKMFLKGCQFSLAPLSLRAAPGGSHPLIHSATESVVWKLGSPYSILYQVWKGLLDCLQFIVLLFQQTSGWLESPSRIRACKHDTSCSWR